MAEEQANGVVANGEQKGAQFSIQKIYLKDASFEAPNSPAMFSESSVQPSLQLNLAQNVNPLAEGVYEVVLALTLTCTAGEKSVYLVEVKQAGIFAFQGFDARTLDMMLGIYCPNTLFPYGRQAVSDLIQAGGFPPFVLQPINFEALYAEQLRRRQEQANQVENAQAQASENA